jgi:hypothetical protein
MNPKDNQYSGSGGGAFGFSGGPVVVLLTKLTKS